MRGEGEREVKARCCRVRDSEVRRRRRARGEPRAKMAWRGGGGGSGWTRGEAFCEGRDINQDTTEAGGHRGVKQLTASPVDINRPTRSLPEADQKSMTSAARPSTPAAIGANRLPSGKSRSPEQGGRPGVSILPIPPSPPTLTPFSSSPRPTPHDAKSSMLHIHHPFTKERWRVDRDRQERQPG